MAFSFGIIGGGWYGCHIASSFRSLGFEVTVFEAQQDIMQCASGNNQFRLHQGFHYARHYRTRLQSRDGYMRFMERYPKLSEHVETNLYAVPESDSLIDFLTYRIIMTSSGVEFSEVAADDYELRNCAGALLTNERVLLTKRARAFFRRRLEGCMNLGVAVSNIVETPSAVCLDGASFDYMIDATWGGLEGSDFPVFYEPTLLLYYTSKRASYALTLVDGDLCSIYPTDEPGLYTLSSVPHTRLGQFESMEAARGFVSTVDEDLVTRKRRQMEEQVQRYYPRFREEFEFAEPQLSVKTKLYGAADDRSCYVAKVGRRFKVMSGKIDTIFYAADTILSMIESENGMEVERY